MTTVGIAVRKTHCSLYKTPTMPDGEFPCFHKQFILFLWFEFESTRMDTTSGGELRDPFVCPSCDVPYCSSIDSENAPAHLKSCAHTMCVGCVKEKRKVDGRAQKTHPYTTQCAICGRVSDIHEKPIIAENFIDLIAEIGTIENSSRPPGSVIEPKQLSSLKCPGCCVSYSTSDCRACIFACGHTLCVQCVDDNKDEYSERLSGSDKRHAYSIECHLCDTDTVFTDMPGHRTHIEDAIEWLNNKKEEQVQSLEDNQFTCRDCGHESPYDRGVVCVDCTTASGGEQIALCAFCALYAHKSHDTELLLPIHLKSMKEKSVLSVQWTIVNPNLLAREIVNKYTRLMDRAEKYFSSALETIPLSTQCSNAASIQLELESKQDEYKEIAGLGIPHMRKSLKSLEKWLSKFAKDFPGMVVEEGESEQNTEIADEEDDEWSDYGCSGCGRDVDTERSEESTENAETADDESEAPGLDQPTGESET